MKDYIQVDINTASDDQKEILLALLADAGYEGFQEEKQTLKAFIPGEMFDELELKRLTAAWQLNYKITAVKTENWNATWESSFEPVIVGDFCAVRADFHPPVLSVRHEIVITPKMSFGTGHHATTFMMIEAMQEVRLENKKVFDFGTGTGVLAILAEKCGAGEIDAVDNDDWSIANAKENIVRNECSRINLQKADRINTGEQYDVILANINRNIILQNLPVMRLHLREGGLLLLSGLLKADETEVTAKAWHEQLILVNKLEKHNWICLQYVTGNVQSDVRE